MALKFYKGMTVAQAKAGLNVNGAPVEIGSILFPKPDGSTLHIYLKNGSSAQDIIEYGGGDGDNEALEEAITTMIGVGNIKANSTIAAGSTPMDILLKILCAKYYPYIYSNSNVSAVTSTIINKTGSEWNGVYAIANGTQSAKAVAIVSAAVTKTVVKCKTAAGENTYTNGAISYNFGTSVPTQDSAYNSTSSKTYNGTSKTISNVAEYALDAPTISDTKLSVKIADGSTNVLDSEDKAPAYYGNSNQIDETDETKLTAIANGTDYFVADGTNYKVKGAYRNATIASAESKKVYGYHPIYIPAYMGRPTENSDTSSDPIDKKSPEDFSSITDYWAISLTALADGSYVIPTDKMISLAPSLAYHVEKTSGGGDIYAIVNCPDYKEGDKFQVLCPTSCKPSKLYLADLQGLWKEDGSSFINFTKNNTNYTINGLTYNIWEFTIPSGSVRASIKTVIVFTHNN